MGIADGGGGRLIAVAQEQKQKQEQCEATERASAGGPGQVVKKSFGASF